jgi:iron uptake system component EfeO
MKRLRVVAAVLVGVLVVPAAALAGSARQGAATKVTVTLTDTKLGVSPSGLQAGSTTFTVVNHGKRLHAFQITGPGLKTGLRTAKLAPGKSAKVTLDLQSGAYMLTLSNPSGLGMSATHWLQVIPRTVVSGGTGVTQTTPDSPSAVCGGLMP